ncbi:oxidoreductase [Tersicoccus solisilvae]|uniref:Oxidoreductase n=1 Tax=Tersicoccus solisilvae TaxID=1882339 RepID=A0ABQ1NKH6_9MICC|nr:sulfurtransferase TusA family protein [Tersicoccus solisilvae]GGC79499.1 oxidoreductase [Tersicoccus solisilvae]
MAQHILETDGQVCPFPLVEAKRAIDGLPVGDELVINFDCTQATDAIPQWAADEGYPVTNFARRGAAEWTITVQKA